MADERVSTERLTHYTIADFSRSIIREDDVRDMARELLALRRQEPVSRIYDCGCVLCICEGGEKCYGCGAKSCGKDDVHCEYKQERIRAVRAAPPAREGWVMVPMEPTAAMLYQGIAQFDAPEYASLTRAYRAMLAAAPKEGE